MSQSPVDKIKCNGIKPSKSEIYKLAAELLETKKLDSLAVAVDSSMLSHDYYQMNYCEKYKCTTSNLAWHDFADDLHEFREYGHTHRFESRKERILALLMLAAIYESGDNIS